MTKGLLNERPWLIGEIATPTVMDLLRDIVYADQGSPQQLVAIETAWIWLNPKSIRVEVVRIVNHSMPFKEQQDV